MADTKESMSIKTTNEHNNTKNLKIGFDEPNQTPKEYNVLWRKTLGVINDCKTK